MYDVTRHGHRFLLLNVVLNWFEEWKRRAGPGR